MMDLDGLCLNCMQFGMVSGVCAQCQTPEGFSQKVPYALPAGTVLHGQYLVGGALGRGGFGITYIALDLKSGMRVAIKEYMPEKYAFRTPGNTWIESRGSDADYAFGRSRFLQEAQTIYALRGHESIIQVLKLFEENNSAYFAMEFLDGEDLKHSFQRRGSPMTVSETLALLRPIFDALCYVHQQGVVHRDVSPDNIFLCRDGSVKLIDFGAAYASLRERGNDIEMVVKRGFAPLEQYVNNCLIGPWSDVYALGGTIYYCVTGEFPLDAPQRNFHDELKPPSQMGASISLAEEHALLTAMAVSRENRYRTVEAFRDALYAEGGTPSPRRERRDTGVSKLKKWYDRKVEALTEFRRNRSRLAIRCVAGVYEGSVFEIGSQPVRLGRDAGQCNIVYPVETAGMSRLHCELMADKAGTSIQLKDFDSTFGTQIISKDTFGVCQTASLDVGDGFIIGKEVFTVILV